MRKDKVKRLVFSYLDRLTAAGEPGKLVGANRVSRAFTLHIHEATALFCEWRSSYQERLQAGLTDKAKDHTQPLREYVRGLKK